MYLFIPFNFCEWHYSLIDQFNQVHECVASTHLDTTDIVSTHVVTTHVVSTHVVTTHVASTYDVSIDIVST